MTAHVSQAELSRQLGVSRQAINDLVRRGVLPTDDKGRLDPAAARVALSNRLHPGSKTAQALQPPAPMPVPADTIPQPILAEPHANHEVTSYHVARTLREAAEAKIAQLKLREMCGELVRASAVRSSLAKRAAGLREALLQLPARVVPLLAANPNAEAMDTLLRAEIIAALAQLAEDSP